MAILEEYLQSQFTDWWPLHYYLGRGYSELGRTKDAVTEFRKVLQMNGSHIETMKELLLIYEAQGDTTNIKKYTEKIKLIEAAQKEEQAKQIEETKKENERLETEEPKPIDDPESFAIDDPDIGKSETEDEEKKSSGKHITKRLGRK